jgi:arabinogalactan endo-1,4-beta-galactosidase
MLKEKVMKRIIFLTFLFFLMSFVPKTMAAKDFIIGADISALTVMEQRGIVYRDNNQPADLITILKNNGFNTIRLRLFLNPKSRDIVTNDLPYTLELAKRAKAQNMKLLLNFHYSDTWADPQQQTKPTAWSNLNFDDLKEAVQSYTLSVMGKFKDANLTPEMVQVGNEITPGMLWPDGKVSAEDDNELQWEKFASLLNAGIEGVKAVSPDSKIMIHIDQGGKKSVSQWFFGHLNKYDVKYDIVGLSYYPWWHGTIDDLKENLNYIASDLKKDVVVVEAAYAHKKDKWFDNPGTPFPTLPVDQLPFPLTPQGQYDMLHLIAKTVLDTRDNRGIGVCYWFPESVPVNNRGWLGGSAALFDESGNALPAIHAFSDAAKSIK